MAETPLQLTASQEDRAQRLHSESVVVNCYGGPFSGTRIIRGWRSGQLRESGEWIPPLDAAIRTMLVPDMKGGGVDCVVATVGSFSDVAVWLREFQTSGPAARLALNSADVLQAKRAGNVSFVLTGSSGEISGTESDLDSVLLYHQAGVRLWSLTHSNRNIISDGCGEESGCGLSRFGKAFVRELNQQQILIDVSHISDAGFWDVLEHSEAPILATHSNCRALCDHPRNLTDDMIKALVEKNGLICLNFFPSFVKPENSTVGDLIDHIDHIKRLAGSGFVGLGPDFCAGRWGGVLAAWWARNSSDNNARRLPVNYPAGIEDITQMLNVTRGLVSRGYSDDEIRGILGGNFLRTLDSVVAPDEAVELTVPGLTA
jgi:membrane dipeptidase